MENHLDCVLNQWTLGPVYHLGSKSKKPQPAVGSTTELKMMLKFLDWYDHYQRRLTGYFPRKPVVHALSPGESGPEVDPLFNKGWRMHRREGATCCLAGEREAKCDFLSIGA